MSNPAPPDSAPPVRLKNIFGFRRKVAAGADPAKAQATLAPGNPHAMRLRIAEFEQMQVADVMVARSEIKAVEVGTELGELLKYFAEVTHSRLPVFRETLDQPLGFVHIKDLVAEVARDAPAPKRPLDRLHREVLYVPPSMKLTDLLVKMQSKRIHLALVVDEYGGTDGLVTLEDLVEEIVGDIEDEHDDEEPMFVRRSPGVWEADARTEIDDFAAQTGLDLSLAAVEADIGTLGGVAFTLAGRVPARGEVLRHPGGAEIEIIDADDRRTKKLRVRQLEASITRKFEE